jgi:hypothetical protein
MRTRWAAAGKRGVLGLGLMALVVGPLSLSGAAVASHPGYRLLGGDGGVFAFGAPFVGSAASDPAKCPPNTRDRAEPNGTCWSMAATGDGGGYWILNGDTNRVFTYGNAVPYGQPADRFAGAGRELVPNGVAIVSTPSGLGYWVLESGLAGFGTVLAFGDAAFFGDQRGVAITGAPVALVSTPSGHGYWIADSDGGVFAYGDAGYFGSMGGRPLTRGVVGMAATTDGRGYWLVAADGGIFSFGDAVFAGSMGGRPLNSPMVAMAADPDGPGYWTVGADGGVFAFGGAPFLGSTGALHLGRPIFALVATP